MIYNLENKSEHEPFLAEVDKMLLFKKMVELKEVKKTRSNLQNRALHLYFTMIADQLNEMGQTFKYESLRGLQMELMFTPELIKTTLWKPLQFHLFGKMSTTNLTTDDINKIVDIITLYFGEKGILIEFPNDAFKNIEDEKNVK